MMSAQYAWDNAVIENSETVVRQGREGIGKGSRERQRERKYSIGRSREERHRERHTSPLLYPHMLCDQQTL